MIWYYSNLDYRHTLVKDTHESKPHGTPTTPPFPDTHTSTLRGSVPRTASWTDPNYFMLGWIKYQIKCVIHRAKVCHFNNTVVLWPVFTFCITLDWVTIVAQLFPNDNLPLINIFQTHHFCLTMLNSNHTDTLNTQWHHLDRIWALSNTSVIVIILWPLFYHTSYGDTHDERAHTHTVVPSSTAHPWLSGWVWLRSHVWCGPTGVPIGQWKSRLYIVSQISGM